MYLKYMQTHRQERCWLCNDEVIQHVCHYLCVENEDYFNKFFNDLRSSPFASNTIFLFFLEIF